VFYSDLRVAYRVRRVFNKPPRPTPKKNIPSPLELRFTSHRKRHPYLTQSLSSYESAGANRRINPAPAATNPSAAIAFAIISCPSRAFFASASAM